MRETKKKRVCRECGNDGLGMDKLWPLGYGEWICSSCSITESIHASYDAYDYSDHEIHGRNLDDY